MPDITPDDILWESFLEFVVVLGWLVDKAWDGDDAILLEEESGELGTDPTVDLYSKSEKFEISEEII